MCPNLIAEVERSGLRGKGGAGFPTAVKMAAVATRRRGVVVANGTEGEPASTKDKMLLSAAPHLVIDGAMLAAEAVAASEIVVCVDRSARRQLAAIEAAIGERISYQVDRIPIRLVAAPSRYLTGEESALVHWLNGGDAKPTVVPPRPFERGVGGRPTLIQNVETLAHIALIARFGAQWFRSLGTQSDPGTTLLTLSGGFARPGVYEVPMGATLSSVLAAAGTAPAELGAILVGGYFGTWIPAGSMAGVDLGVESLAGAGAGLGCRRHRRIAGRGVRTGRERPDRPVALRAERGPVRSLRARTGVDRVGHGHPRPGRRQRTGPAPAGPVAGHGQRPGRLPPPRRGGPFRGEQHQGVLGRDQRPPASGPVPGQRRAGVPPPQARGLAMSRRLTVNPITCVGHGLCAELFPERITLDDWGYPIIDPRPIPEHLEAHARRAVAACPTLALMYREAPPAPGSG